MDTTGAAKVARLLGEWRQEGPAQTRLAATLRSLVLDGLIPLHTRLPPERALAGALEVSRSTVTAAYDRLRAEGYLVSRRGAGSWVALPAGHRAAPDGPLHRDGIDMRIAALTAPPVLADLVAEATALLPRWLDHHGYEPLGLPVLRSAIARRYTHRGLPTAPEQILVTSGALHGLDLVIRGLLRRGQHAITEMPSYPAALDALRSSAIRIHPVPVSSDGWDVDALEATARDSQSALAYLVPDYQNPTGALMDADTRRRASRVLLRAGIVAVIDETFAESSLDGQAPPPPMAAASPNAITLGSLGKSVWGGLRIGWVRADPAVVQRLAAVRAGSDLASPVLEQLVAVRALERFDEVIGERRILRRERLATLLRALDEHLPTWSYVRPGGGLFVWAELPGSISTSLSVEAREHGVYLTPGPRFGAAGLFERFLRLPFSLPPDQIEKAVSTLALLSPRRARPSREVDRGAFAF